MQIHRLLGITQLLLAEKQLTAGALARRFEVSARTIYRDIEALSAAGVPVFMEKGRGGGIRLLDNYTLPRQLLTKGEQRDLMASLSGLAALSAPEANAVLTKLSGLFGQRAERWLQVDLSYWGASSGNEAFQLLKQAILDKQVVSFWYYSAKGEETRREAEPLRIVFKEGGWYLWAFCCTRKDLRFFKLTRIQKLALAGRQFDRELPPDETIPLPAGKAPHKIVLRISPAAAFRAYDEFGPDKLRKNPDGSFTAEGVFWDNAWVLGYVLSFGAEAEVLSPPSLRKEVLAAAEKMQKHYR